MSTNFTFEESTCLELAPFSACGSHGACISAFTEIQSNDGSLFFNQKCECDSGWERTEEMLLYFLTPDEIAANLGPCNLSPGLLKALYSFQLLLSLSVLFLQLSKIQKKKQLKRLAPLMITLTLLSILSIYKLAAFDTALMGKDFFATFLFAETSILISTAIVIFFEKYLLYMFKTLPFSAPGSVAVFKTFQKINHASIIFDTLFYQFFWISAVVPDEVQYTVGNVMMRIALAAMGLQGILFLVSTYPLFRRFHLDMDKLIESQTLMKANMLNLSSDNHNNNNTADDNIKILLKLKKRTYILRRASVLYSTSIAVVFFSSALWGWLLLEFTYMVPLFFTTWPIIAYFAMSAHSKKSSSNAKSSADNHRLSRVIKDVATRGTSLVRSKLPKSTLKDSKLETSIAETSENKSSIVADQGYNEVAARLRNPNDFDI